MYKNPLTFIESFFAVDSVLLSSSMELVPRICSNSEEESPTMAQNSTIFAPTISLLNISAHLTNLSERFHDDPFHYNVHRASFTDDGSCKKRRLSTISVDSISIKLRHKR